MALFGKYFEIKGLPPEHQRKRPKLSEFIQSLQKCHKVAREASTVKKGFVISLSSRFNACLSPFDCISLCEQKQVADVEARSNPTKA